MPPEPAEEVLDDTGSDGSGGKDVVPADTVDVSQADATGPDGTGGDVTEDETSGGGSSCSVDPAGTGRSAMLGLLGLALAVLALRRRRNA